MNILTHRYIARIIIEAETPLMVGSGDSSLLTDLLVQRDLNDLPMIQGSSLLGVLRHSIENQNSKGSWKDIFGHSDDKGLGARLKISSAYFMKDTHHIVEGLATDIDPKIIEKFTILPVRQHVRISHKGTAVDQGLFNNEVVYKGTRFKFELELKGTEHDEDAWKKLLNTLSNPNFRIGQGTRNGYGKLKPIEIKTKVFDLTKDKDLEAYQSFGVSMNDDFISETQEYKSSVNSNTIHYQLELIPDDFFIFSAGSGDDDADNKPYEEEVVTYTDENIEFEKHTVIPATSIKGAISHRVAYYYNQAIKNFAMKEEVQKAPNDYIGTNNEAVKVLFGYEANDNDGKRGLVTIDDVFIKNKEEENKRTKILNHVAIDRFTGGAIGGALFSEKVTIGNETICLNVIVENTENTTSHIEHLEKALIDICRGLLPLGGMTNKGHGFFTGKLFKDNEKIYNYQQN